jgi:galactonate dehydratase
MLDTIRTYRPEVNSNLLIVELRDDGGVVGLGETFFGAETVETYLHEVAAPLLFAAGRELTPATVGRVLESYVGYQGSGAELRGKSALDIAAWDIVARRADLPLYELLGGRVRDSVPVYNTCAGPGYVSSGGQASSNWGLDVAADLDDLNRFLTDPGELACELLEEGITAMKIWPFDLAAERTAGAHISNQDIDSGCEIVGAIRESVGGQIEIMVELHGLWNLPSATAICQALEPYRPVWVEDPIRPDAISALSALKSQTRVPIAVGETLAGRRAFLPLLRDDALDYAIVDLTWTGGVSEAVSVVRMAEAFAVAAAPHDCTGPIALTAGTHLSMSGANVPYQETVRAFYRGWYPTLVDGLPEINRGQISAGTQPGLGLTLHPDLGDRDDVITRTSNRKDSR